MKYIAIRSEGGLIPYDLLDKIANEDAPGQKAADFGLAKGGGSRTKSSASGAMRRTSGTSSIVAVTGCRRRTPTAPH